MTGCVTLGAIGVGPTVAVCLIMALAGFCQGAAGFGFALVAVPLAALVINPKIAIVVVFLQGMISSLLLVRRHHHHIDRTATRRLSIAAVVTMPLGIVVLHVAPAATLRLALGITTCFAALFQLLSSPTTAAPAHPRALGAYASGAISGVLNTALATNGPPLVIYLRYLALSPTAFRATISAVFSISNVVGFVLLAASGSVTAAALIVWGWSTIPAIAGFFLGAKSAHAMAPRHFILLTDIVLLSAGILAITKAIAG